MASFSVGLLSQRFTKKPEDNNENPQVDGLLPGSQLCDLSNTILYV
jgi:hypothetical protein